jgi:thiol-disulfide isomerase/thioredoxin
VLSPFSYTLSSSQRFARVRGNRWTDQTPIEPVPRNRHNQTVSSVTKGMSMRTPALVAISLLVGAGCRHTAKEAEGPAIAGDVAAVVLPESVAESWRGKVVVADFWATWCGPCRASSPNVQILHEQFRSDPGVLVVAVHADDNVADPGAYLAEHEYTYPLVAKGGEVADAFGVNALPTFVVLDQSGREVLRHVGMMSLAAREKIAAKIRALRG